MRKNYKRALKTGLSVLGIMFLVLFGPGLVFLARAGVECRMWSSQPPMPDVPPPVPAEVQAATQDLYHYLRAEDQTYLTLPEWYVVYSSDEYAAFIAEHPPSQFPYFQAIGQYWESYYGICAITREHYPFNGGYHLSMAVVGLNFTAEMIGRGLYENTIGRLTEVLSSPELTEEDRYAQSVAEEYGAFLHMVPWFDFPFADRLRTMWDTTAWWGPNPIRKWERKLLLSADYSLKAFYAMLIKSAADAVYGGPDDLTIYAWVNGATRDMESADFDVAQMLSDGSAIVGITRFERFSQTVPPLVQRGLKFNVIAGNDELLITAFAPADWTGDLTVGEFLFAMPIPTDLAQTRAVIRVPVSQLHLLLQDLAERGIKLEHIYDY